ncbi:hypothetical protein NPIL_245641 [Nephila pilipes]|uniref:PiggyBac transposable element-derived protein domain-containing protein n=1 Tax=Nephila pilipes TaxID=299642 RepID=A0A8X6NXC9_NEPPI|nr:hypothetical protein NPIL_245641 [Nephila pilipes]
MAENLFKKIKRASRNICIHVPAVICRSKDLTYILVICKYLITDRITESIVEETNKYICSVKTNYSRSRDARDTDGAEIEALLGLLYLVGIYFGTRRIVENGLNVKK